MTPKLLFNPAAALPAGGTAVTPDAPVVAPGMRVEWTNVGRRRRDLLGGLPAALGTDAFRAVAGASLSPSVRAEVRPTLDVMRRGSRLRVMVEAAGAGRVSRAGRRPRHGGACPGVVGGDLGADTVPSREVPPVRRRAVVGAAAVAAIFALAAGCGGSGDSGDAGGATTAAGHGAPAAFEGGIISPRREAPPLELKDIDGRTVDIRDLKGHPVLVTFVYSHCPDVCPLIMSNLRRVREQAGPEGKQLRVLAVSVDPVGDTPEYVRGFLADHQVQGFVRYLIGSRPTLERVWSDWQISARAPKDDPEAIEHSSLVYGVTASGELATAYPVGFTAEAIARDVPLLAES